MKKLLGILLTVTVLMACKKDSKPGSFTMKMNHFVESSELKLNERIYTSDAGHTYEISKYLYYISNVSLIAEDGSLQTTAKGFLVRAEDVSTHTISLNEIPAGKYNKIQFDYGFSKSNNVEEYLDATVENQNMFWPAPLGPGAYHYMKLEGMYDSLNTGKINPYLMHSGPTNGADNSFTVQLSLDKFEIDDNSAELNINLDMNEWIQNPTAYNFSEWKMVMMNQNAQDIYKANGQSVFSAGDLKVNE